MYSDLSRKKKIHITVRRELAIVKVVDVDDKYSKKFICYSREIQYCKYDNHYDNHFILG